MDGPSNVKITRRAALRFAIAGGAVAGAVISTGFLVRDALRLVARLMPGSGGGMMGSATSADMSMYMEMFDRHKELRRTVEEIPGGVRTTTGSDAPDLVAQLQAHVSSMYTHVEQRAEVTCMSKSLPILFRNASAYHRELVLTDEGLSVTETSTDPAIVDAIRKHAQEVSGFVRDGMPAMMRGMMGG